MHRRPFRLTRGALAVLAMAGALLLVGAPAASAHAQLEHTSPASGAVLQRAPVAVTLTFGEGVGVDSQDIRVYDDHLNRVDDRDAGHLTGSADTVGVRLPAHLGSGTYSVSWRVISADSHPISGGFTFSIGTPSTVVGTLPSLAGGHRSVGVLLGATRLLGYLGLIAGPGALIFLLIWPTGRERQLVRRLIVVGVVSGAVGTAGQFLLQAPYTQGAGVGRIFDRALLADVAHSHFGQVLLIRLALWIALAVASAQWFLGRRSAAWAMAILVLALPVTWATIGHGDVGTQVGLSLASESLHVLAVTTWIGGLTVLSLAVLRRATRADALSVLPRFSTVALTCVLVITVTGLYQAWREIGLSWTGLMTTTYGRLVVAKILGLAALYGLGAFARWVLRGAVRYQAEPSSEDKLPLQVFMLPHLRRSVLFELGIAAAVLVFTGILVNTEPATESIDRTVHRSLSAADLRVDVTVAPGRIGPDSITLVARHGDGRPQPIQSVSGSLALPAHGISSLPVRFTATKGSDRASATTSFEMSGTWQLTFDLQTSPIDATQFTTSFTIH
jgi:copper transport protein